MKQQPNKHKAKVRLAGRMMTEFERRNARKLRIGRWDSKAWNEHRSANLGKQTRQRRMAGLRRMHQAKISKSKKP